LSITPIFKIQNKKSQMKKYLLIAVTVFSLSAFTINSAWKNDPAHSQLGFTVSHLGINDISGFFKDFTVSVNSSKADFSDAVFTLSGKTASIDTRVEARDNHLKSADFFDVEKFPELSFKSTSIKKAGKGYKLNGNLTLHGITKPVMMNLIYKGKTINPMSKKETVAFQISGSVKRSDFEIGAKFPDAMVSEIVRIKADGEFVK